MSDVECYASSTADRGVARYIITERVLSLRLLGHFGFLRYQNRPVILDRVPPPAAGAGQALVAKLEAGATFGHRAGQDLE